MKRLFLTATLLLVFAPSLAAQDPSKPDASNESKLIYADFQNNQNGRPVSKRGGQTRLNRYSQNSANPPQFRGMENTDPPAPALARVTDEDRAAAFDLSQRASFDYACQPLLGEARCQSRDRIDGAWLLVEQFRDGRQGGCSIEDDQDGVAGVVLSVLADELDF